VDLDMQIKRTISTHLPEFKPCNTSHLEGFSFVTPVPDLNTPNTGKEDDDDDEHKSPY
jgi:hypothetical protein